MKEKINNIISSIREDIDQANKYKAFLEIFGKSLKERNEKYVVEKLNKESFSEKEVIDLCMDNYVLEKNYVEDLRLIVDNIVVKYEMLVLLDSKGLLEEDEIKFCINLKETTSRKTKFIIDQEGNPQEKSAGYIERVRQVVEDSKELKSIMKDIKSKLE